MSNLEKMKERRAATQLEVTRLNAQLVGVKTTDSFYKETRKRRDALGNLSRQLGTLIRKAENPGDLSKVLAHLPARLSDKDLKGGGTKAVKSEQNEAARKRF